jgi:hypothetical protein
MMEILIKTSDSLLKIAKNLYEKKFYRPAVLEAVSALEIYITEQIQPLITNKVGRKLSEYLMNKTKFQFLDRVEFLVPFVHNIEINKGGVLWGQLHETRRIRNQITHKGLDIDDVRCKKCLDSIESWLNFLNILELKTQILNFKQKIEQSSIHPNSEDELSHLIQNTLKKLKISQLKIDKELPNGKKVDYVFDFGKNRVILEYKLITEDSYKTISDLTNALIHMKKKYQNTYQIDMIILLIFQKGVMDPIMPVSYDNLDENLWLLKINLP